jgi:hypothetical protein
MGIDYARKGASRKPKSLLLFPIDSRASGPVEGSISLLLNSFTNAVREKALRSAAHAGAKVFYYEMLSRVSGIDSAGPQVSSGKLLGAVYRWHDEKLSASGNRQVYAVGPNKKEAPHWFLVEYGHFRYNKLIPLEDGRTLSKNYPVVVGRDGQRYIPTKEKLPAGVPVAARPFVRPTFDAVAHIAIDRMRERLAERIKELQSGAA